ncbi:ArsR family transcriptional regulator [Candidatus Woesearchaeota archaeon CG07_land_8_20_14_0_80_44_23]|nr:MAG: ArsR family transcriptional regulator [Candidatus Woesearchaeota archaeon CG07_land_8_20_14_0_80_44_23]
MKNKYLYINKYKYMNMNEDLRILKAISDETRLKIVKLLLSGEKCVSEITPLIGKSQSNISIQLSHLKNAGVVESRRQGKKAYYSLSSEKAIKMINALSEIPEINAADFVEEV